MRGYHYADKIGNCVIDMIRNDADPRAIPTDHPTGNWGSANEHTWLGALAPPADSSIATRGVNHAIGTDL